MLTNQQPHRSGRLREKQPLLVLAVMLVSILQSIGCFSKAPTQAFLTVPRTPTTPSVSTDPSSGTISTPRMERQGPTMIARHPTADVLNPILWLGCHESGKLTSMGSGVAVNINGGQYLATALHVIGDCELKPWVRYNGQWNAINWQTLAVDEDNDIAVLKTETILDPKRIPVLYGEPAGLIYGQIGYALGFPGFVDGRKLSTDHITEVGGRPVPIVSLAVANFKSMGNATYSASYINAGFSGGAIVFPVGNDKWTIAGIITHFPTVRRAVYRDGIETGDYINQHTGLVGYTPFRVVENLIMNAEPTQK